MIEKINIIDKLKSLQKNEGLTNLEMAEQIIGIPEKTYDNWRSGRRKPISGMIPYLEIIAEALEKGQVTITRHDLLQKTGRIP